MTDITIEQTTTASETTRRPFLNLGCGRITLPAARPIHHVLVSEVIYAYPEWVNVDKVEGEGVDQVFDLFRYPWPLESNSFDGALLAHIVEHIPHGIEIVHLPNNHRWAYEPWYYQRRKELEKLNLQDGWFAFWSELWRVLTPGAIAHVLCPHGRSDGGMSDPTHTRYVIESTFNHSMQPNPNAPFVYNTGCHFVLAADVQFTINEIFADIFDQPDALQRAIWTQFNVVNDLYAQLRAVKPHPPAPSPWHGEGEKG